MISHLRKTLQDLHHFPLEEQKRILEETLLNWMGNHKQIDDISLVGFRVG